LGGFGGRPPEGKKGKERVVRIQMKGPRCRESKRDGEPSEKGRGPSKLPGRCELNRRVLEALDQRRERGGETNNNGVEVEGREALAGGGSVLGIFPF